MTASSDGIELTNGCWSGADTRRTRPFHPGRRPLMRAAV